jgi:hypothetical protein
MAHCGRENSKGQSVIQAGRSTTQNNEPQAVLAARATRSSLLVSPKNVTGDNHRESQQTDDTANARNPLSLSE